MRAARFSRIFLGEREDAVEPMGAKEYPESDGCSYIVTFRPAVTADREALERKCLAYRKADRQSFEPHRLRDALDAVFGGDPLVRVWMIEIRSRAVGYLAITLGFSLEAGGGDAFVDELYLDDAFRGQGIGKRAMQFAESECRKLGVRRLCLEVERHNSQAKTLYEHLGFRDRDRFLMSKWLR